MRATEEPQGAVPALAALGLAVRPLLPGAAGGGLGGLLLLLGQGQARLPPRARAEDEGPQFAARGPDREQEDFIDPVNFVFQVRADWLGVYLAGLATLPLLEVVRAFGAGLRWLSLCAERRAAREGALAVRPVWLPPAAGRATAVAE